MNHLGKRLRDERIRRGLTSRELARLAGYRRVTKGSGRIEQFEKSGHEMWDANRRGEAVQKYKAFLRHGEHYQLASELPAAYRRVIEYEAEQGDPGEARDWIIKAWDEWPGRRMELSFESQKAERLWHETKLRQQQ